MRGFKRLQTRFFGAEIVPPTQAYEAALDFKLAGLARAIDQSHVEAKLVRRGLAIEVVAGTGRRLAAGSRRGRGSCAHSRGSSAASRSRCRSDPGPVEVTATELALPRRRRGSRSQLPSGSSTRARAGGCRAGGSPSCRASRSRAPPTSRSPVGAPRPGSRSCARPSSAPRSTHVPRGRRRRRDRAARTGSPSTSRRRRARCSRRPSRATTGRRPWPSAPPSPTGRRLRRRRWGSSGGSLVHDPVRGDVRPDHEPHSSESHSRTALSVAPGGTFSFNDRVGERTIERGFRSAPVIIKDEYDEDVGGGVSAGRDDRVQRRLGSRAEDRRAEPALCSTSAATSSGVTRRSHSSTST